MSDCWMVDDVNEDNAFGPMTEQEARTMAAMVPAWFAHPIYPGTM